MELEIIRPADIERRSFAIIREELAHMGKKVDPIAAPIVLRCIHTSADFDYAENLYFTEDAVEKALAALRGGATIVTDTQMAKAGINRRALAICGSEVRCFMADPAVAAEAAARGVTRAAVSMERAAALPGEKIFAIGNAPTALLKLAELIDDGIVSPALVIGAPVGFVNVVQAKEEILRRPVPAIVARGRKGGSNIAACICNALLYMLSGKRG